MRDCIAFALLCSVIGPQNSRHSLDQSDAKLTPIATWPPAFSRALSGLLLVLLVLQEIFLSSDKLLQLLWFWFSDPQSKSALNVIRRCFGFSFSTLIEKEKLALPSQPTRYMYKIKSISDSLAFSHASGSLLVFTMSFHLLFP